MPRNLPRPKCKVTWQRDRNASLNMARCFGAGITGAPKPECLYRPVALSATIGRIAET